MDRSDWLEDVLRRYESPLLRFAMGILGDIESGRDVVQDTFLQLCRERPEQIRGHLAQWLFTVCRNRALDVLRKENRMSSFVKAGVTNTSSIGPNPSAYLDQKESLARILQVLKLLPKNQQEVIRLKFQNDMSYKEISHVTKLSVTNVGYLIHTALKSIRETLKFESNTARESVRRVNE